MIRKAAIDYSAFHDKDGNEVIKEVTIVDIDTKCEQHWIFKGPHSFNSWAEPPKVQKYNTWISSHFHGLEFQFGFSEYDLLLSSLESVCSEMQLLFAEDLEKAKGLEKLFKSKRVVFSLAALGCPPMPWRSPPSASEKEEEEEEGEDLGEDCVDGNKKESSSVWMKNQRPCLYHGLYAPWFFCTRSKAHYLVDWCSKNPHLVDMNDPAVREMTFVGWKLGKPSPKDMAESGFVLSTCFKDTTKCLYCGLSLHQWEEGDDIEEDHYYNSPFCKFHRYQMQLLCEKEEKEKQNSKSYVRNRSKESDVCNQRDFFNYRYGQVSDLTWDQVKTLCTA